MKSPILFLVFNRPETTKRVFAAIREHQPSRLYIAADGPRKERPNEAGLCAEVREIVSNVDWPCQTTTLFRDSNLGCHQAVSSGISWFFDQEPEGIILEDDCLPHSDFFPYCEQLLERYRDEPGVFHISGTSSRTIEKQGDASYHPTRYGSIWGWATWRRTWELYRRQESLTYEKRAREVQSVLLKTFDDETVRRYWSFVFQQLFAGRIDTWDYQLVLLTWLLDGIAIQPNVNLVSNLGCLSGTHVQKNGHLDPNAERPIRGILPLIHPSDLTPDRALDEQRMVLSNQSLSRTSYYTRRIKQFFKSLRSK